MKNKNPANLSAAGLVEMAKENHRKIMEEASKKEEEHKKRVAALTEKEKELTAKIKAGKEQYEKMKNDFEALEKEQREANLAEIKKSGFTTDDVKSGKININQFHAQGISDDEIKKEVLARTLETLEKSSDAVREKGEEITRLEFELYGTQSDIYHLMTYPVNLLKQSYRRLSDMLDFQLEGMSKDYPVAQSLKIQKEHQLMLIEKGVAVSGGYAWRNISLREAYKVRLDPILQKKHIPMLIEKLDGIEGTETTRMTITFHPAGSFWPGDPIEIMIEKE